MTRKRLERFTENKSVATVAMQSEIRLSHLKLDFREKKQLSILDNGTFEVLSHHKGQ